MQDPVTLSPTEQGVVAKAAKRLIPLMALLYFVSFLDRVNVGYAALTMNQDVGLSASAYGFGAGIFFLGYFLFEVPSNLLLQRFGARAWIARIMVTWGILSVATAFVQGPVSFWIIRFLLGLAEAGFFPGMILYLTYWFPNALRGRIIGSFLIAIPLSSVLGAPLSTALLGLDLFGLKGWQSMFILEGIPAVALGFAVLRLLPDRPGTARWLTADEARTLEALVARDGGSSAHHSLRHGLTNPRVWHCALIYFTLVVGLYGFGFWAPQMIKALGNLTNPQVGAISTIPYAAAAVAMHYWGRRSDARRERVNHLALPCLLGAAGFAGSAISGDPILTLACFTVAAVGIYAALPVFWTLPTAMLSGTAAAAGIALINAIGNLGGYAGPYAMGALHGRTGSFATGLWVLSAAMLLAGLAAFAARTRHTRAA